MPFCGNCGNEMEVGSNFCKNCGASASQSQAQQPTQPQTTKRSVWLWLIPILLIVLFTIFSLVGFFILSLIGAQGQPATVIPPSKAKHGVSESSVAIPKNLSASSTQSDILLKWKGSTKSDVEKYKIYKSLKPGKDYSETAKIAANHAYYSDTKVKKGITYYYVVTAVVQGGAESGNSNQVGAIIDTPPLIPQGIYSWNDVKVKCENDPKYLALLSKVTGLSMIDVKRLALKEKQGMALKKTLLKGTVITNSTKNYKILPNYILKTNRIALTDENGIPYVLTKCGNPMKEQVVVTPTGVVIQQTQITIINIINVMPTQITNVIINAGQTANNVTISILPESIRISLGSTFAPPPPDVIYVDPADFGDDALYPPGQEEEVAPGEEITPEEEPAEEELPEGQQWIEKGKLSITADPPDPSPGQRVTMTIHLSSGEEGVEVSYEVHGTDGYSAANTLVTNQNGEAQFTIPGGQANVRDTITVSVPSKNLEGSAEYQF